MHFEELSFTLHFFLFLVFIIASINSRLHTNVPIVLCVSQKFGKKNEKHRAIHNDKDGKSHKAIIIAVYIAVITFNFKYEMFLLKFFISYLFKTFNRSPTTTHFCSFNIRLFVVCLDGNCSNFLSLHLFIYECNMHLFVYTLIVKCKMEWIQRQCEYEKKTHRNHTKTKKGERTTLNDVRSVSFWNERYKKRTIKENFSQFSSMHKLSPFPQQ